MDYGGSASEWQGGAPIPDRIGQVLPFARWVGSDSHHFQWFKIEPLEGWVPPVPLGFQFCQVMVHLHVPPAGVGVKKGGAHRHPAKWKGNGGHCGIGFVNKLYLRPLGWTFPTVSARVTATELARLARLESVI